MTAEQASSNESRDSNSSLKQSIIDKYVGRKMRIKLVDLKFVSPETRRRTGRIGHLESEAFTSAHVCEEITVGKHKGDMLYGREVRISVFRNCPFEFVVADSSKLVPSWYATLVRVKDDESLRGMNIVAASTPYSSDWLDYGRLRLPFKQGKERLEARVDKLLSSKKGWQIALRNQKTDLFMHDTNFLTAMLAKPDRVDSEVSFGSRTFAPWPDECEYGSDAMSPGICFGVCDDIPSVVQKMLKYHVCATAIQEAKDGIIFKKVFKKHAEFEQSPKPIQVHPDVKKDAQLIDRVMKSAIKKAIAGPIHSNFLPPQRQRLSTLANWIFVRQLYDLCRRKDLAETANNETVTQKLLATFSSNRLSFDKRIKWIDKLNAPQTALINCCSKLAKSKKNQDRQEACAFAAYVRLNFGTSEDLDALIEDLIDDKDDSVAATAKKIYLIGK